MNKEQLHNLRKRISDLFYWTFDNLTLEQRGGFVLALEEIDNLIKEKSEDF